MSEMTQTVRTLAQPQSDDASPSTARDFTQRVLAPFTLQGPGTTSASSIRAMPSQCRQP